MTKPITASAAKSAKEPNYTDEMVERLRTEYLADPTRDTVERLAEEMNKSYRSVIAKLSNMEIYIAPPRTTKSGEPIVRKEELVSRINEALHGDFASLIKANKRDLTKLADIIEEVTHA